MWKANEEPEAPKVPVPARCPVCRSNDLTTTSKVITTSTYWRCRACGEVWNTARRDGRSVYR